MNITNERLFCYKGLESLASVHIQDVEYVVCVQQYYSAGKEQRAYCSMCAVPALFLMFTVFCRDVACRM
jgi:hypothetical protein